MNSDSFFFTFDLSDAQLRQLWSTVTGIPEAQVVVEDERVGRLTREQLARWHALLRFIHTWDRGLTELFEDGLPPAWKLPPLPAAE